MLEWFPSFINLYFRYAYVINMLQNSFSFRQFLLTKMKLFRTYNVVLRLLRLTYIRGLIRFSNCAGFSRMIEIHMVLWFKSIVSALPKINVNFVTLSTFRSALNCELVRGGIMDVALSIIFHDHQVIYS